MQEAIRILNVRLSKAGLPLKAQDTTLGPHAARMLYTRVGRIPVSILRTQSTQHAEYRDGEAGGFLDYFERFLLTYRPDALIALNPGPQPDPVFDLAFHIGKSVDLPTVLWLSDESAVNLTVMQNVDYCVVTSEYLRRRCWDSIGLVCKTLPHAFDWDEARLPRREPNVVTVLARTSPGEYRVGARIVERLSRVRPDIPVALVAEDWRVRHPVTAPAQVPWTVTEGPGPRSAPTQVYSETRILVAPSLGHGLFDRTVAEAMINGIPVLVSSRGALPETVGDAGLVIDIPEGYQPESTQVPRADDISPWVDTIIRLWDDSSLQTEVGERCAAHSQCWHPSRTIPIYEEFFRHLRPQPGPPLLPKWSDDWVRRLELPGGDRKR